MKKTVFSILSSIIFSVPLVAQETAILKSVTPGDRIRVSALEYFQKIKISQPSRIRAHVVGTLVAANADTLLIKIDKQSEPLSIPLSYLEKIEVSRGKKSRVAKGALLGLVIGAVTAEGLCANTRYEDSGTMGIDPGVCGLFIGGPAGGLIGGVIGAALKEDRWEEVPLNSAFSFPLVAQQQTLPESLLPGNRVRVNAPQFFQKIKISKPSRKKSGVVGTVMAANSDTLLLRIDNQPELLIMSVPFASLRKLEVSRGRKV